MFHELPAYQSFIGPELLQSPNIYMFRLLDIVPRKLIL